MDSGPSTRVVNLHDECIETGLISKIKPSFPSAHRPHFSSLPLAVFSNVTYKEKGLWLGKIVKSHLKQGLEVSVLGFSAMFVERKPLE